jgi:hypothetical protein
MKTSKILSSNFTQPWGTGANLTYYHSVQLEGEPKPYTIGAKQQNPDWLSVGKTIDWEFKDEAKGSIKKAQKQFGGIPSVGATPSTDPLEIRISAGIIAATILFGEGKISGEEFDSYVVKVVGKFDQIKELLK